MARRTVRRDRRNQQHGHPAQQRLMRNPEAVSAIRRAEADIDKAVEFVAASGSYLERVGTSVAPEYQEVLTSLVSD